MSVNEDKIRALVNEQAADEGLWFEAETCAEAYVQQALRRLHAVIEGKQKELELDSTSKAHMVYGDKIVGEFEC